MEYVYGKMVQLGVSGFLMGGGLVAFTLVDDYIRFRKVPGGKPGQIGVAGVLNTTASTATQSPLLKNKPLGAAIRGSQHASTGTASLSVASLNTRLFKDWFFRTPPENSVRTPSWWWLRQAFDNRPPWQRIGLLAAAEGLRTAKIVTLASGAAGMIGVALYGRDGDKIYSPVHNRAGFAVGAAIGTHILTSHSSPAGRLATSLLGSAFVYYLAPQFGR